MTEDYKKIKFDPNGTVHGMRVKLIDDITMKMIKHDEKNIIEALIGSKIIHFKLEKDKRTKHMWDLTIITDASDVPVSDFHKIRDDSFLVNASKDKVYRPSRIKLRVRF